MGLTEYPNGTLEVNAEGELSYPLPDTFDATNDSITITVENQPDVPFLTLANSSIIIYTSLITIEHVGIHQVMILLTDSQGGRREYSLYVTITAGDIELKVFEIEDWGIGDEGLIDPYIH